MARRSYDQYCALARSLDILGERWAMLVIRELLIGPKRFRDLRDGLPGIGANALSTKLKSLERDGLVTKRRLPPPAASTVYELTERGRALAPAVRELIRWGLELMGSPSEHDSFRPGWLVTGLGASFDPSAAKGVRRSYRLDVDDQSFLIRIEDGEIEVAQADGAEADVIAGTDSETLLAIASTELSAEDAIDEGRVTVDRGDPAEVVALSAMFARPAAASAEAAA